MPRSNDKRISERIGESENQGIGDQEFPSPMLPAPGSPVLSALDNVLFPQLRDFRIVVTDAAQDIFGVLAERW